MNTEELREKAEESLHFDAHEFDGLRETLEQEAEGLIARVDQFVRENPMLCLGIAAAAGFTLGALGSKRRGSGQAGAEIDSRRM